MIPVTIIGAAGRMGRETVKAVGADAETQLVGAVGRSLAGQDAGEIAGIGPIGVPIGSDIEAALQGARVAVELSVPAVVKQNVAAILGAGVAGVVGTTGLTESDLTELDEAARAANVPLLIAPNFAIGAILMMRFAAEAAKYFDSAEIIERHHDAKLDAPSGTAFKTALAMREARGTDFARIGGDTESENSSAIGARGGAIGGVSIHSVRLPGYLAHQEVVFGMAGQTLTIRHDAISRECYMPGVLRAIKKVWELPVGLTFGLEAVL